MGTSIRNSRPYPAEDTIKSFNTQAIAV